MAHAFQTWPLVTKYWSALWKGKQMFSIGQSDLWKKPLLTFIKIYVCLKILLINGAPALGLCVTASKLHTAFELKSFPSCSLGHFSLCLCTIHHTGFPTAEPAGSVYCVILIVFSIIWYHCIVKLHNKQKIEHPKLSQIQVCGIL